MRILLAEDEVALNKALSKILERNNYTVDSVYDGEEALSYLSSDLYDLLLLDIMMPKLDGIEVLKSIRKNKKTVPVIMLTAKSQREDKIEGLDLGADDYVTKPFDTEELLARIRAVLRRQNENDKTPDKTYGNLSLNLKTYELSTRFSSVKLNHKEFQIMELLIKNPKTVISTEKIMDKIWNADSNADLNVVWVYISGLRKKLSDIKSDVKIKINRHAGYYLEEDV